MQRKTIRKILVVKVFADLSGFNDASNPQKIKFIIGHILSVDTLLTHLRIFG